MSLRSKVKPPAELMTIAMYASITGMSESSIRSRIAHGHWAEGVHFWRKGNGRRARIMLDAEAIYRWWAEQ